MRIVDIINSQENGFNSGICSLKMIFFCIFFFPWISEVNYWFVSFLLTQQFNNTCILRSQFYLCYKCKLPWIYILWICFKWKSIKSLWREKYGEKKILFRTNITLASSFKILLCILLQQHLHARKILEEWTTEETYLRQSPMLLVKRGPLRLPMYTLILQLNILTRD